MKNEKMKVLQDKIEKLEGHVGPYKRQVNEMEQDSFDRQTSARDNRQRVQDERDVIIA
jgi:predicted  nucleic acid-binding Zn-ribbon protein